MEKESSGSSQEGLKSSISITVMPKFLDHQSEPQSSCFSFAYTVQIENKTEAVVQLLRRHWVVFSGGERFTEVEGEGVIGEQPMLEPGASFQYTSSATIKDPIGSMEGSYTFIDSNGAMFEAKIPNFKLVCDRFIQ